jgi:hypothetical protein
MDVSDGPYIYIGYHLPPGDGGFCCSSECAHDIIDNHSLRTGSDHNGGDRDV